MNELQKLKRIITKKSTNTKMLVDEAESEHGSSWLDVERSNERVTIEWRPKLGFGVYADKTNIFGEGPSETYQTPELAAKRVLQILRDNSRPKHPRVSLSELRELREVSQEKIAKALGTKQGAISRLENQNNAHLATIQEFVKAMGGRIEIRAHFDNCDVPISISNPSVKDQASGDRNLS